jgi:hypothetical protein
MEQLPIILNMVQSLIMLESLLMMLMYQEETLDFLPHQPVPQAQTLRSPLMRLKFDKYLKTNGG